PTVTSEPAAEQTSTEVEGTAFAAAAGAGKQGSTVSPSAIPEAASEPPVPSEAAAAWENWQHIRDSVMAPQSTAALAESVVGMAAAATPAHSETGAIAGSPTAIAAQPSEPTEVSPLAVEHAGRVDLAQDPVQSSTADSSALESEALASIVDSVLAELKPKLMEQIAKKLNAEKK